MLTINTVKGRHSHFQRRKQYVTHKTRSLLGIRTDSTPLQRSVPCIDRPSICRRPDSHTYLVFISPFFSFCLIWRCRFFRVFFVFLYHCRLLFVWRVRRTFVLPCDHGLDFLHLCENSINQSNQSPHAISIITVRQKLRSTRETVISRQRSNIQGDFRITPQP